MVVDRGSGRGGMGSCYLMGIEFQFYKMKRGLEIVCIITGMYLILNFKMVKIVNFMLCYVICYLFIYTTIKVIL